MTGFVCLCSAGIVLSGTAAGQASNISLQDLSAFRDPGKSWQIAADVTADLNKHDVLFPVSGTGVLVNLPDKKHPGQDLFSQAEYGDVELELDYMMAPGANSGIYLEGRYEVQLLDSWAVTAPRAGDNGGIYERWDDHRPQGQQGYEGYAPRVNASRAPGLWQHMKISFRAPRFDAAGRKTANARMLRVELNGVLIHDNVELMGPTRGSIGGGDEKPAGPLRFQGDHGAVAFRNIRIQNGNPDREQAANNRRDEVDPILVDATSSNTILRSFMDVPGSTRIPHAVSVGSPMQVHYTYDMDKGMLLQVWRGGFLDATPMWHDRGNGCSRPRGAVQYFGKPAFTLSRLSSADAAWIADSTGTGYRPKGYVLDEKDRPAFRYIIYGSAVTDVIKVLEDGHGLRRELTVENPAEGLYARLAEGSKITVQPDGMYVVDGRSYYLQLDDAGGAKPVVRQSGERQELIVPVKGKLAYSILF